MMAKKKWYVVWVGKTPGIYTNWDETKDQVHGFQGAKYQSFKTESAAKEAYENGPQHAVTEPSLTKVPEHVLNSISVDAACSGNPGIVEYRGVYTDTQTEVFHKKIDGLGTNNLGEFLAIIHALGWMQKHNIQLPIYTDSGTAMAWIKNKKAKTTLEKSKKTDPIFELLSRAEEWLHSNKVFVPLNKWQTSQWGEIPADFGRK